MREKRGGWSLEWIQGKRKGKAPGESLRKQFPGGPYKKAVHYWKISATRPARGRGGREE